MSDLKQKIRNTQLFIPEEKIEILSAMDTYHRNDLRELESIIDEYDAKYKQIRLTFRQSMLNELDSIQAKTPPDKLQHMKKAVEKIKSGLTVVTSV